MHSSKCILYLSLLEYLNASDMVRSDHDSYEHEGGACCEFGICQQVANPLRCFFDEAEKLSPTLMNKHMSGVVIFEILR
jgi:hypothetical protein